MNKGANAAGELSIGIWDAGWVVGDEKAELEFGVVVENVKVLETNSCCVIVGYSRSTLLLSSFFFLPSNMFTYRRFQTFHRDPSFPCSTT